MKVSLIISTYNRPDALAVTLESVKRQSRLPDEVIVGDDGSGPETAALIERFKADFPVPLIHVWQEDKGFRLAKIRNRSVAAASGDYIVQTDGDVMLHRHFIRDHVRMADPNCYCKGNWVKLDPATTATVMATGKAPKLTPWHKGIVEGNLKWMRNRALSWGFAQWFKRHGMAAIGCNMGYFRSDFMAVNGYDEDYEGWGKEDDDLAHRLVRLGRRMRDVRFAAVLYHLWHKEAPRNTDVNAARLAAQDAAGIIRATHGVDQYL